ncbi:ABC transporter permease [Desulfomonile tiedjei]|nr:ABC transporter permease subunit [Desulfomonile tiedjei]
MILTENFWQTLAITLKRFGISLFSGAIAGFGLGLVAGLRPSIRNVLEPVRWSLMSIPPVVLVTIGMVWFGMGSIQTIFVTSLLILPIMYVNTIEGIDAVDRSLLEMGRVYKAGSLLLLRDIYLPSIGGPLLAGLALSAGFGIRIVVLAEVLGAYTGIGYEFSLARTNLETATLFAWIVVCLMLVGVFEFGVLNPARNYIMRWKEGEST